MKYYLLASLVLGISIASCKTDRSSDQMLSEPSYAKSEVREMASMDLDAAPSREVTIEPKIIQTASLRIQVEEVKRSTAAVRSLVKRFGGSISSMNWTNASYTIENAFVIRVPAPKLDSLLEALEQEGVYTQSKSIQSQDVTEEYLDIETRLRTKKEVRDRYIDLLRNKAKTVTEVLDAEDKIRVLQEEIESQEGRLRYLSNQVALSTINLEIFQRIRYQPEPEVVENPFGQRLVQGLKKGWDILEGLVIGVFTIWPVLLLAGAGVWVWRRWRKRR